MLDKIIKAIREKFGKKPLDLKKKKEMVFKLKRNIKDKVDIKNTASKVKQKMGDKIKSIDYSRKISLKKIPRFALKKKKNDVVSKLRGKYQVDKLKTEDKKDNTKDKKSEEKYSYTFKKNVDTPQSSQVIPPAKKYDKKNIIKHLREVHKHG